MADFRSILSYIGFVLMINGILMLVPIIVDWVFADGMYLAFAIPGAASFGAGLFLERSFKRSDLNMGSAMAISAISFILISFFGMVPFLYHMGPIDALFESVSGFTTTGLSVTNPEQLPNTLLFWRSFTQWIGGVGILFIFILLMSSPGMSTSYLYMAEGKIERLEANIRNSARMVFTIYMSYTGLAFLLFILAGMPAFDSLLHAFSGISTGGFSTRQGSIGAYASPLIEAVTIIVMILGATSFFVHFSIWKRKFREYVKNPETRLFWVIIGVFSVMLTLSFLPAADSVSKGIFQTVSALTTTGFSTVNELPGLSLILIIILMIIGGYAGSTAGGIKLIRTGVMAKSFSWLGRKISLPQEAVVPLKFGERVIKNHELTIISLFVLLYTIILVISSVMLSFLGYSPINSFFECASAEGTVGFSAISEATMHPAGKVILMVNMLLGRLEIIPFLVLIYMMYTGINQHRKKEV